MIPASVFYLLSLCASSDQGARSQASALSYKTIAVERFGESVEFLFNPGKTYVLCLKQAEATSGIPLPPLEYFVYDVSQGRVLYEEKLTSGLVQWLSEDQIEVTLVPGIVTVDEEKNRSLMGYVYDLKRQKKIRKQGKNRR